MDEIDVLEVFLTEIEEGLDLSADMAWGVGEYQGDEDVIFENWNTQRIRIAMNPYVGNVYDDYGNVIGEKRKYYYQMRLEAKIYAGDELKTMERRNSVKNNFRKYEGRASKLHEDVKQFEVHESGNEKPRMEPTSLRRYLLIQEFDIWFVDTDVIGTDELDAEPIETIEESFEINGDEQNI